MSVIRGPKLESKIVNLKHNAINISDAGSKVQTSSLIEAFISETRPGGDVILATPQGKVRANASIPVEEGDRVLVRLTSLDNSEINAHIIEKIGNNSLLNKLDNFGMELLNKYILQNISANPTYVGTLGKFTARVSYVTANRNTLKYGNIQPGDEITIHIISPKAGINSENTVAGEVIGNSHNNIILNSSIGMLNINAKSNLNVGDKVLFKIGNISISTQDSVKMSITKIISSISTHLPHLKAILDEMQHMSENENYRNLFQLISSSEQHNITLARLLHNAQHVPSNDVERWIEQEIIEPFEGSTKSNILQILSEDLSEINKLFINLKIMPEASVWQTLQVPIPGTKDYAKMRVKRERKNIIEFVVDFEHDILGKIIMQGTLTLTNENSTFPLLDIKLKCSKSLPSDLQGIISSGFALHKSVSMLDGNIAFEVMEPIEPKNLLEV